MGKKNLIWRESPRLSGLSPVEAMDRYGNVYVLEEVKEQIGELTDGEDVPRKETEMRMETTCMRGIG